MRNFRFNILRQRTYRYNKGQQRTSSIITNNNNNNYKKEEQQKKNKKQNPKRHVDSHSEVTPVISYVWTIY